LTLDGQEWKDRRVKLSPIFTSGKIKMMFGIIDAISDRLVKVVNQAVEQTNSLEMRQWCQRYTSDSIGNVAFGLDSNCEFKKKKFKIYFIIWK
jgi:cytochrome P450 family 6